MKTVIYSIAAALLATGLLSAQDENFSHWAFQAGGGFTQGVGRTGTYSNMGWNASLGAGVNFNSRFGALLDVSLDNMAITSATLQTIGVPAGNTWAFSATLDPVIHLTPHRHTDVYITGGGGEFRRSQTFAAPTGPVVNGFGAAPPLGIPAGANYLVYSQSTNKPGIDIGMGVAFGSKSNGQFYAEAKFDKVFLNGAYSMCYLPVTFGFRW